MACAAGEGCPEFVLSGCRFGKRVLAHGRWPVASVSEWPGSLHISFGGCRLDLRGSWRRDTRSDVARPRGVARPRRVVRGDRRGCHERLRVQPTCLRARHPPPLPGHTARGRQEAAFSRHVMSCPRVGSVVNRGCVSEIYVPTNDSQSLSVRPCPAHAHGLRRRPRVTMRVRAGGELAALFRHVRARHAGLRENGAMPSTS